MATSRVDRGRSSFSIYLTEATVNEAEYEGLLLCFCLLEKLDRRRLVVCGDYNLVIRQMRGEIECKAPGLTARRSKALDRLTAWPAHEFLHMKREWNQSADRLANAALQQQQGVDEIPEEEWKDLETINCLPEPRTKVQHCESQLLRGLGP